MRNTSTWLIMNLIQIDFQREEKVSARFTCGHRAMVAKTTTIAIATATRIVFTLYQ
jgi:hypothetical protein